jgi:uncharacterized protein (DUF697 family)
LKDSSKNNPATMTAKQYEELGRIVASVYETGYLNKAQSYRNAFIKGVVGGFGGVVGATVVVALLLWVLSFFGEVPLVGDFSDKLQQTIKAE